MNPSDIAKTAYNAADDKKAARIDILHVGELTTLADYFIICTGTSTTHIRTLADAVEHAVIAAGGELHHREGVSAATWTLLDFGSVVVHIFQSEARDFYALERLWADAKRIEAGVL